ncbi:hypothetical protein [Bacteroides finegoldii]|uniref:hypothetical protein n=1 Tax=Bacteroides finegoldii TaxID=338188 RepID=UPI00189C4C23|nr:hypothetical protein [Bacteroides finegoldii]
MLAPIVIFAFNRPESLSKLKETLERNKLYEESEKYVFVDGTRNKEEYAKVEKVISIAREITPNVTIAEKNKGLGSSIIEGVTTVINQYHKVIVLEDDLVCSENFLSYMNQALDFYQDNPQIFSICGYGLKIKRPVGYIGDVYLSGRSSSWGWGTWKDRWEQVDWEVKDWKELSLNRKMQKAFNENGSDMFAMLKGYIEGRNRSWAIRFCYSQFKLGKYSIHPFLSKIGNNGFGEDATNCKQTYSRFKSDFDRINNDSFIFPNSLELNKQILVACSRYHNIMSRIYSKIRNFF